MWLDSIPISAHLIAFLFPTKIAFAYNVPGGNQPSDIHKAKTLEKNDYLSKLWSGEQAGFVCMPHVRGFVRGRRRSASGARTTAGLKLAPFRRAREPSSRGG